jgi:hypothetical protein
MVVVFRTYHEAEALVTEAHEATGHQIDALINSNDQVRLWYNLDWYEEGDTAWAAQRLQEIINRRSLMTPDSII